jgi:hypothetical protein
MDKRLLHIGVLGLGLAAAAPIAALADATTEAQLRSALQESTAKIAALEDQVANLQASQAPDVAMIEALKAKLQSQGGGEAPAAKAKDDAALKAANAQVAALKAQLAQTQTAKQSSAAQAAALTAQLASTNTGLAQCESKNAQMYTLSMQILDAYAHKDDPWTAFANHEPFIGFKRVQLENLVQDDQDKLYNDQVNPGSTSK